MSNLPIRGEPSSLDNLAVTREEFRLGMGQMLEYLAQTLGGVPGTYLDEVVDPLLVQLQGQPRLAPGAIPGASDDSDRLITSGWARDNLLDRTGGTLTNNLNVPSLNGGQLAGFRNVLINGAFAINYRFAFNVSTPAFSAGVYITERWAALASGAPLTAQSVLANQRMKMRIFGADNNTGMHFLQRVESVNAAHLQGREVTLSVDLSSTTAREVGWGIFVPTTSDTWNPFPNNPAVAFGSWQITPTLTRYKATFNMGPDCWKGFELRFFNTSGLLAGQSIDFQDIQLEGGPLATPFERRGWGLERVLCSRYYYWGMSAGVFNHLTLTANISVYTPFLVPMRVTPTIVGMPATIVSQNGCTSLYNIASSSWGGNSSFSAEAEL